MLVSNQRVDARCRVAGKRSRIASRNGITYFRLQQQSRELSPRQIACGRPATRFFHLMQLNGCLF